MFSNSLNFILQTYLRCEVMEHQVRECGTLRAEYGVIRCGVEEHHYWNIPFRCGLQVHFSSYGTCFNARFFFHPCVRIFVLVAVCFFPGLSLALFYMIYHSVFELFNHTLSLFFLRVSTFLHISLTIWHSSFTCYYLTSLHILPTLLARSCLTMLQFSVLFSFFLTVVFLYLIPSYPAWCGL